MRPSLSARAIHGLGSGFALSALLWIGILLIAHAFCAVL